MSEQCKLTMLTARNARGRGAWCIEHRDYAHDLTECRTSVLTRRAEFAEAKVQRVREVHRPRTSCVECMGWDEFDEEHDESHTTDQVCNECREDMDDELFGVVWPCLTIRAIGRRMSEQCQWGPGDGIGRYCLIHESWMRAVIGTRCPVGELTAEVEMLRAQIQRVRDVAAGLVPVVTGDPRADQMTRIQAAKDAHVILHVLERGDR